MKRKGTVSKKNLTLKNHRLGKNSGVWPHALSESCSFAFIENSMTLILDRHKSEDFAGASGFSEHLFDYLSGYLIWFVKWQERPNRETG